MQSNADHAHLEASRGAARLNKAAPAAATHRQDGRADFLHQSHRVAERAAGFVMGVTLTTLTMYNLALWLMR